MDWVCLKNVAVTNDILQELLYSLGSEPRRGDLDDGGSSDCGKLATLNQQNSGYWLINLSLHEVKSCL
jgi:hypothetical protein